MSFHVYHLTTKCKPMNYFANTKVERNYENLRLYGNKNVQAGNDQEYN